MSDEEHPDPPPPTAHDNPFLAEKMPSWWRPEYQSATTRGGSTVPPASAPGAPAPPPPPAPAPAPAPPAAPSRPAPPHHEQTMVLNVVPVAPPVAILTVTAGPDTGYRFRIKPTVLTHIGRGVDNDVVLEDPATSRRHAHIEFRDGRYVLTDLGSANGTLVNGQRVSERMLSDGDVIKVGQDVILTSIVAP